MPCGAKLGGKSLRRGTVRGRTDPHPIKLACTDCALRKECRISLGLKLPHQPLGVGAACKAAKLNHPVAPRRRRQCRCRLRATRSRGSVRHRRRRARRVGKRGSLLRRWRPYRLRHTRRSRRGRCGDYSRWRRSRSRRAVRMCLITEFDRVGAQRRSRGGGRNRGHTLGPGSR